jgi:3-isopropylmalate/(R)-2-methylmalate dehydratase small subunit
VDQVAALTTVAQNPANEITIDLETQTVAAEGFSASFDIDAFTKHCLLNGLDEIALTLGHTDDIDEYEHDRPTYKPTVRS